MAFAADRSLGRGFIDVPAAGALQPGSDRYTSVFPGFEDAYNAAREDGGTHDSGAKVFGQYNNGNAVPPQ